MFEVLRHGDGPVGLLVKGRHDVLQWREQVRDVVPRTLSSAHCNPQDLLPLFSAASPRCSCQPVIELVWQESMPVHVCAVLEVPYPLSASRRHSGRNRNAIAPLFLGAVHPVVKQPREAQRHPPPPPTDIEDPALHLHHTTHLPTMLGLRTASRTFTPAVRRITQKRLSSGTPNFTGAADNAFNRERAAVKEHAAATSDLWRKLSI